MPWRKKQNSSETKRKQNGKVLSEVPEKPVRENTAKQLVKKYGSEKQHRRKGRLSRLLQYLCSSSGSQPCAPQPGWNAETAMLSALRSDHLEENGE
jgi:hypothetical protein